MSKLQKCGTYRTFKGKESEGQEKFKGCIDVNVQYQE